MEESGYIHSVVSESSGHYDLLIQDVLYFNILNLICFLIIFVVPSNKCCCFMFRDNCLYFDSIYKYMCMYERERERERRGIKENLHLVVTHVHMRERERKLNIAFMNVHERERERWGKRI